MRRLLAAALVTAAISAGATTSASASCARLPGAGASGLAGEIAAAPAAFVGTVISTTNRDRVARVQVESVWKGGPVPSLVTVSGTPDQGSAATSVDRRFSAGQRYLFIPTNGSSPFQDNSCTATRRYVTAQDSSRPASAHPPAPGSDGLEPAGPAWLGPAGGIGVALLAGIGAWLIVRHSRRRNRPT